MTYEKDIFKRNYKEERNKLKAQDSTRYGRSLEINQLFDKADKFIDSKDEDIKNNPAYFGRAMADANKLMKKGVDSGNFILAYRGAEMYEKMGRGNAPSVKRKLKKAYERAVKRDPGSERYEKYVESFMENNSGHKTSQLEKTAAAASIVGILGGLFFLSSNITGNAVANVSPSSSNIFGAVLLVVGLVAGFFWISNKK